MLNTKVVARLSDRVFVSEALMSYWVGMQRNNRLQKSVKCVRARIGLCTECPGVGLGGRGER